MHLRPGVGNREIGNAPVIPPPNNEDGLEDDARDRTGAPDLPRLTIGGGKSGWIPIAVPFLDEMSFPQTKVDEREDNRDEQQNR